MRDVTRFLLREEADIAMFRKEFRKPIEQNRESIKKWINNLDWNSWHQYIRDGASEKEARFVVGLVCLLYIDGDVNVTFMDGNAWYIRRDPSNLQEWKEYIEKNFYISKKRPQ